MPKPVRAVIIPIGPSIAYVPLTLGRFALIDVEDAALVGQWNWYANATGARRDKWYAVRAVGRGKVQMQVVIMGSLGVDHRNNDGLDNRRSANLRKGSHSQNLCNYGKQSNNTTGFKGVSWVASPTRPEGGAYSASINYEKKRHFLGYFGNDPVAAALAYDAAAKIHHGEFACLNFQ